MRCPQCGYYSYAGLRRCKKCGALQAALALPEVVQPVMPKKSNASADIPDSGAKKSRQCQIGREKISFVGARTPKKLKPFPEFLLERDRQPSFFDQVADADSSSGAAELTEPVQEEVAKSRLLPRRIVATLIDLVVLGEIWYAFIAIGSWSFDKSSADFMPLLIAQVSWRTGYYLLAISTTLSYFTLFHGYLGQTIGKMLLRVQVVAADGSPVTMTQALLRTTGGIIAVLCAGFGYLGAFFDRQQRGWNDRLAGTRVVTVANGNAEMMAENGQGEDDCEVC